MTVSGTNSRFPSRCQPVHDEGYRSLGQFRPLWLWHCGHDVQAGPESDTLLTMVKDHEVTDLVIVGDAFARQFWRHWMRRKSAARPTKSNPQTDHLQWRDEPRDQAGLAASSRHGAC